MNLEKKVGDFEIENIREIEMMLNLQKNEVNLKKEIEELHFQLSETAKINIKYNDLFEKYDKLKA